MNLEEELNKLQTKTENCYTNIDKALDWNEKFAELAIKEGVANTLKRNRREVKKLIKATKIRPSIGVYGQSQVGKSYLIGSLAKPQIDTTLNIKVGDEVLNFISDINPPGGQESTGVVVRFTTKEDIKNSQFPIQLELLSFLDVISILVNAYHSDLKEWSYDNIIDDFDINDFKTEFNEKLLKIGVLEEDDTNGFCEYIKLSLSDSRLINHLDKVGYFEYLSIILCRLELKDCIDCLSYLWGKNQFIGDLVSKISNAIKVLEFSETVYVKRDVFENNDDSLVCVERVRELFNREDKKLILANDKEVEISFSVLASLTREVKLALNHEYDNNSGREFLNHCDLLDFPGSKSREKVIESVFNSNTIDNKLQLFIRGKVFYLFDHYSSNEGLSSLLYCMDNNPPEDQEAPARLKKWIDLYAGSNEIERKNRIIELQKSLDNQGIKAELEELSPLLIIATKFNFEMDQYWQGKEDSVDVHESKWQARFDMNFNKFMSLPVRDKWVESYYGNDTPFKFVLPVRDPHYSSAVFSKYDEDISKEKEVRPERRNILKAIETSFLKSEHIKRYIPNEFDVWNELSTPNGTGVNQIFRYLKFTTNPELTILRLTNKIDQIVDSCCNLLKFHLISGDLDDDLLNAKREATKCRAIFHGASIHKQNILARALDEIKVQDTEVWKLFYDYNFNMASGESSDNSSRVEKGAIIRSFCEEMGLSEGDFSSVELIMDKLRGFYDGFDESEIHDMVRDAYDLEISDLILTDESLDVKSSHDGFVDLLLSKFNAQLLEKIESNVLFQERNEKLKNSLLKIFNEVIKSEERLKLKAALINKLELISPDNLNTDDLDLVSSSASSLLNEFIFTSGASLSSNILINKSYKVGLFSPTDMNFDRDDLKDFDNVNVQGRYFSDFAISFKDLFEQNVHFEYGVKDPSKSEGNIILKKVLEDFDSIIIH